MMQILDATWFNKIGIVMVQDPYEGIKYFIGEGMGDDEMIDRDYIAAWGSTFPKDAGDILFNRDPVKNGIAVSVPQNREQAETMIRVGQFYINQLDNVTL